MIFKCKICGGELNIERGQSIIECEYCGVKQTLPRFFDENVRLMYDRANNYLLHNEFDKAESIYSQILYTDKEDADAYWSLVLCKYGITYVKDPKTEKYIPTCNRTYYSSIFDDENYKKAIKYANEEKKALFEADAKTIDDIQHSIIAISRKEKPFDIFISYKETGTNGGRTKDSIAAQNLYEKLTSEGYKVFFSRITLEDKIGTEYEPYIYAALASSKVMITICSSRENIEAVWVKNEWSRFLAFAQKDRTKTILPLYFDMDNTDLPDEFAHLPSYDMKSEGFEQDLIRGIKKLIPLPIMEKERREKRKKLFKKIGIGAVACLVIAAICMIPWFMKLPDYNAAMKLYYDKNYPEATWAFDELGGYRNSKTMKDKCEKSWRKSLATVISVETSTLNGSYAISSYYISPNGNVEFLPYSSYSKTSEYEMPTIDKHGKCISIAGGGEKLFALHEDGFVENAKENNNLTNDWNDIIQISSMMNCTSIALKSDGTIVVGDIYNEKNNHYTTEKSANDEWLNAISQWNKIKEFDAHNKTIIGLRYDGTLCGLAYETKAEKLENILKNFYDVKHIKCYYGWNDELTIAAMTNHNTIMLYRNGTFKEYETENVIDINIYSDGLGSSEVVYLTSLGELKQFENDITLLRDIVRSENDFFVSRNGSIYHLSQYEAPYRYDEKVCVYEEWTERIK